MRKKSREERDTIRNRLSRLKFRATELEVKIDTELFDEARVVACTLVGSANRVMMNRHFTTLFIDEAAQALEAACWIAIGKADRVILAGDHHQLPPTIKCIEAEREGLGRTLMQKIAHAKPETVSLLKVQYRMHEDIMRFSSQWFYHNELESAPEVSGRGILRLDTPIVWFDKAGHDHLRSPQRRHPPQSTAEDHCLRCGAYCLHLLQTHQPCAGSGSVSGERLPRGQGRGRGPVPLDRKCRDGCLTFQGR